MPPDPLAALERLIEPQAKAAAALRELGGVPQSPRRQDELLATIHAFEYAAAKTDFPALLAEMRRLREKNQELNRREQAAVAEAVEARKILDKALADKGLDFRGGKLSSMLMHADYVRAEEEVVRLRARVAELEAERAE